MESELRRWLGCLYEPPVVDGLVARIQKRLGAAVVQHAASSSWQASDVVLITYADAISSPGEAPLRSLRQFLHGQLEGLISQVHLLPFFPYTSDDGFAVSDYRRVEPCHGDWSDIRALSDDVELIFDLVINHASSEHAYFQEFLADHTPGNQYFISPPGNPDVSAVTRPRASPLLQTFETASGPRNVWCTFSRDQVDWDFSNPDVLYEFVDVVVGYIENGASWMRIDAIAYLWKVIGTNCIHLPQTHAVVKLLRVITEKVAPGFKILTETNVPLAENLSYFGDGDEAHIVYNFSLPPLLLHALLTGDGACLTGWCQSLPVLPPGCTFLNFTASHDGIGLRPAEGILSDTQLQELVSCVESFDGRLAQRRCPDGSLSPYEANISLFEALRGTVDGDDQWQVERFLLSQGLMMALAGVPALYYNSVLAAPNDLDGLAQTGRNRTINRKKWTMSEIDARLADSKEAPAQVLQGLKNILAVRREQPAFHPEGHQQCLSVDRRVFVVARQDEVGSQRLVCIFNLSRDEVELDKKSLTLRSDQTPDVCFVRGELTDDGASIRCGPYAMAWINGTG